MPCTRYLDFPKVKGYATFERAKKRGEEVAALIDGWFPNNRGVVSWIVVPGMEGRWVPAFNVQNIPGGPGPLLGLVNVCTFN